MEWLICELKFVFINVYIIVSERTVLEGGSGGPPRIFFLVIFVRKDVILGNTNGYICLDIMPQQEGKLTVFET